MTTETGGPAFPALYQGDTRSDCPGLSMRDYFAAKAMQGLNTNPYCDDKNFTEIAHMAYQQADAMLAARAK